jgi:hypothetical protein
MSACSALGVGAHQCGRLERFADRRGQSLEEDAACQLARCGEPDVAIQHGERYV